MKRFTQMPLAVETLATLASDRSLRWMRTLPLARRPEPRRKLAGAFSELPDGASGLFRVWDRDSQWHRGDAPGTYSEECRAICFILPLS